MKNLILAFICLLLAVPCQARIIFVDANTPDNNDGSSWAKAYKYLQDALADANSTGDVNEIWVAQGIYTPDSNSDDPNGSGDRKATFQLINGVTIKGGYAGFGQPDPNARDTELYETILSGDLDGNDVDVNDPCDLLNDPYRADNCYCLFYHPIGTDLNTTAILNGFTITSGNANGSYPNNRGSGMYNHGGSPTLINCTFSDNSAMWQGGGMYNVSESNPTVTKCTFSENSADEGGGMYNHGGSPTITNCNFSANSANYGGGMYNVYSSPTITNCTFSGNSAELYGGGMHNGVSSPVITNCTFNVNSADNNGGGIYNDEFSSPALTNCTFSGNSADLGGGMHNAISDPTVTNCTFSNNSAGRYGGGMFNWGNSSPKIINCTFNGNSASRGGGMSNDYYSSPTVTNCTFSGNSAVVDGGGMGNYRSIPTVTNCIFWDNTASNGSQIFYDGTVIYSDVQGGWPGLGNIDADPCFVEPGYWADANDPNIIVEPNQPNAVWVDGDYHLKSQGWRWDTQRKVWTWDDVTSRCIDAGNPGSPLGDEPITIPDDPNNIWGQNLRINMGTYGGTAEASMPPYDWAILGDLTNDGLVNLKDYAFQAADWLNSADQQPGDLNRDSLIYISDLVLLVEDWLKQTTWHE